MTTLSMDEQGTMLRLGDLDRHLLQARKKDLAGCMKPLLRMRIPTSASMNSYPGNRDVRRRHIT